MPVTDLDDLLPVANIRKSAAKRLIGERCFTPIGRRAVRSDLFLKRVDDVEVARGGVRAVRQIWNF